MLAEHQAQTNVWMWFPCFVQLSEEWFVLEAHQPAQPKFGELPRAQSVLGEGLFTSSIDWSTVASVVQNTAALCNIRAFYVHSKCSILQGKPFSFLPQAPSPAFKAKEAKPEGSPPLSNHGNYGLVLILPY